MDEPVVNGMSALLEAVGTVISSFATWITTLTTSLISNPIVQLLFGMLVALMIFKLVIGLVKSAGGAKKRKRK